MSAAVTSAIIAGASSLAASGASAGAASKMNARAERYNRWALKEQQRYQKEYADYLAQLEAQQNNFYWDKYNSPAAQRRARVAAGFSPYADVGGIQTSSVDPGSYGGSSPSAQSFSQPGGIPVSPLVGAFGNATQQTLSALQTEANIELTKSQALKTRAETTGLKNTNSMFDIVKSIASEDLTSKRFGNILKEFEAKYAEANAITDLESKQAKIAEINSSALERLASAAKTDADRITVELLRDSQKRSLEASASLSEAQAATEPHRALNLEQDTMLKMAQEETEQLLRSQKFELTRQQARSAAMSFVQERILAYRQAEELARYLANIHDPKNMWDGIWRIVSLPSGVSKSDFAADLYNALYKEIGSVK